LRIQSSAVAILIVLAATLAAYLRIKPPSGSVGKPLLEVISE
jgi:hypothetical protein